MALTDLFGRVRRSRADTRDLAVIDDRLRTVDNGARCNLATQYRLVLQSILDHFGGEIDAHVSGTTPAAEPEPVATVVDIDRTRAILDETHRRKQPDWTFEARWSGKSPADRHPAPPPHTPTT